MKETQPRKEVRISRNPRILNGLWSLVVAKILFPVSGFDWLKEGRGVVTRGLDWVISKSRKAEMCPPVRLVYKQNRPEEQCV